jgi:hypothetical protein
LKIELIRTPHWYHDADQRCREYVHELFAQFRNGICARVECGARYLRVRES